MFRRLALFSTYIYDIQKTTIIFKDIVIINILQADTYISLSQHMEKVMLMG